MGEVLLEDPDNLLYLGRPTCASAVRRGRDGVGTSMERGSPPSPPRRDLIRATSQTQGLMHEMMRNNHKLVEDQGGKAVELCE